MRNSEIIQLVQSVNDVLIAGVVDDDNAEQIVQWAKMGIDEVGSIEYRVLSLVARQLVKANEQLDLLNHGVGLAEGDVIAAERTESLRFGEPTRQLSEVDADPEAPVDDDETVGSQEEPAGGKRFANSSGW